MIHDPQRSARRMRSRRWPIDMVRPSGWWQEGVTKIARGGRRPGRIEPPARVADVERREARAGGDEGGGGAVVARLLHPDLVAGVEEEPRQEVEGRLRAVGDDDLVGGADDAARGGEVARDRCAELGVAGDEVGPEEVVPRELRAAGEQARPGVEGKLVRVGQAGVEGGDAGLAMVEGLAGEGGAAARRAARSPGGPGLGPGGAMTGSSRTMGGVPRRRRRKPSSASWS